MKILFGTQFYTPVIGGVQEVMRQLAEALAKKGHDVTVVTTLSNERNFNELNNVKIKEFDISGNQAAGIRGKREVYQDYVISGNFDLLVIMAAQQWTFDALWDIFDNLKKTKKVFIPCGFSALHDPVYFDYFKKMPKILKKMDHLIFHSTNYRDINFSKKHDIKNFSVIPCGASDDDFNTEADTNFKIKNNIDPNSFLFLTVGTFTGLKGHLELVNAFSKMQLPKEKKATLILNGNTISQINAGSLNIFHKVINTIKKRGVYYFIHIVMKCIFKSKDDPKKIAKHINKNQPNKKVIISNFPREQLVQAFIQSDLFVFASNIEYSPLVLFETAAAGTPFLSVNVGNSPEIAEWTGAGVICPSRVDELGYTRVDEDILAEEMLALVTSPEHIERLGKEGRKRWKSNYSWSKIAERYENLFIQLLEES